MTGRISRLLSAVRGRLAGSQAGTLPASIAELTAGVDGPVVLLVNGDSRTPLADWLEAFGAERLTVLSADGHPIPGVRWLEVSGRREIEQQLMLLGSCAAIVDEVAADPVKQFERWARFGPAVGKGGWYAIRATSTPETWQERVEDLGQEVDDNLRAELVAAAAALRPAAGHLLLPQLHRHLLRVGERSIGAILPTRNPELVVTELAGRPAIEIPGRARVVAHGSEDVPIPQAPIEAQRLVCRWYRGELEVRTHLVTMVGDTLLPPSFRHSWANQLRNDELLPVGRSFAELKPRDVPPAVRLEGDYFDLNGAWPGHFGHVMTESLGKLWAWDEARAKVPGLKGLYRLPPGAEGPTFEAELFGAFGIPAEQIHWATTNVLVDSYVSPTVPWHNGRPFHFHPAIEDVWERLRTKFVTHDATSPSKIFVSRGHGERACRNQAEVEAWFAARGFAVVFPERLPLPEQATLFANAKVVAGFAGSALFNLLYADHVDKLIVLTHEGYTARNEWLFGMAVADELHYFWSEPDVRRAPGVKWRLAFHSTWAFDFDRFGAELEEAIAP